MLLLFTNITFAQDFILRTSDPEIINLSIDTDPIYNAFDDTNNDGIPDSVTIADETISGNIITGNAQGFNYDDGRNIVFYPTGWTGLPEMGTKQLLGFIHYFDNDGFISTFIAIIAEQAEEDDTSKGMGVFFYDNAGLRVGAPTTIFVEKAKLRVLPIYQEWVEVGLDFGIGSNPQNSQFFVFIKDLGLQDKLLIVLYQLYQ